MHVYCQRSKRKIRYEKVAPESTTPDKKFLFRLYLDEILYGEGIGQKVKTAQLESAKDAIKKLTAEGVDVYYEPPVDKVTCALR